jgi:hypothetical protein
VLNARQGAANRRSYADAAGSIKRLACVISALAVALACAAAPAAAVPVRECGNYGYLDSRGMVGWTRGQVDGAGIFNVTSRNVPCSTARRFVLRYRDTDTYFPTWRCRESNDYEFSDVRCAASRGRVIHWQTGA